MRPAAIWYLSCAVTHGLLWRTHKNSPWERTGWVNSSTLPHPFLQVGTCRVWIRYGRKPVKRIWRLEPGKHSMHVKQLQIVQAQAVVKEVIPLQFLKNYIHTYEYIGIIFNYAWMYVGWQSMCERRCLWKPGESFRFLRAAVTDREALHCVFPKTELWSSSRAGLTLSWWADSPEPPLPTIVFSSIRAHSRIWIPRKWAYLPLPSSNCHWRADLTFPPMGLTRRITWSYWSLSSTWSLLCKCLCNSSRWEVLTWPRSLCTDSSATNPSCSW